MLSLLDALLGGALLLAGRKLFWLFVSVIGFVIGIQVANRFLHGPEWFMILVGLALGIVFAVLAIFLETLTIGIAGFLGGGYILLNLAGTLGFDKGILPWVIFLIGGVLGAALVAYVFNWALIIISSLVGSTMILQALNLKNAAGVILFAILVGIGVIVQAFALNRTKQQQNPQHNN